jgi:hypothetical protein
MANRNLVDVLANLVRKGFGKYMIGAAEATVLKARKGEQT